jgi:hypothetical protein
MSKADTFRLKKEYPVGTMVWFLSNGRRLGTVTKHQDGRLWVSVEGKRNVGIQGQDVLAIRLQCSSCEKPLGSLSRDDETCLQVGKVLCVKCSATVADVLR